MTSFFRHLIPSSLYPDETPFVFIFQEIGYPHERMFRELDPVFSRQHVEAVFADEQPSGFHLYPFFRVQNEDDVLIFDHFKDKQSGILVVEIDPLPKITVFLKEMIPVPVLSNGRMEMPDDPGVPELFVLGVPETVPVQPELGLLLRNHDLF